MGKATREVTVCDFCGTHDDVSDWPQIGADSCSECAYDQFDNHQCKTCQEFDVNTLGPLVKVDGENKCPSCIEDAEDEARWAAEDAEDEDQ